MAEQELQDEDSYENVEYVSSHNIGARMTTEERRAKRRGASSRASGKARGGNELSDDRFAQLLAKREDDLLELVANINKVYQEKLKKDAPFMTFVFCGMQSAGKR